MKLIQESAIVAVATAMAKSVHCGEGGPPDRDVELFRERATLFIAAGYAMANYKPTAEDIAAQKVADDAAAKKLAAEKAAEAAAKAAATPKLPTVPPLAQVVTAPGEPIAHG